MKKELKNTFSWSVSRDAVFTECPRKYYFSYYGYWGGWEHQIDERTREVYVLKQLKSKPMWVGQVVHECIARSIKNLARGVPLLDLSEILSITRGRMRQDFLQSRDGRYWEDPKVFCGLFEHEYDVPVSKEEWREAADTVDLCLKNFYASDVFAAFQQLDPKYFAEVEQFSKAYIDGVEMIIRLDCATREGDNIVVWDWKTGKKESRDALTVQMACYAYYARTEYKTTLDRIVTRRFDLLRTKVNEQQITEPILDGMLKYVMGSIKDMQGLLDDPAENVADEERFVKAAHPQKCRRCQFFRVCKPSFD